MTDQDTPRPDPAPDDSDAGEDLRHELERAAGGRDVDTEERDEPAFDSDAEGMDTPPPG
jgi:hypothetical protein